MTVVARKIRERGMLFSAKMVLALLDGRKTQIRRAIKFDTEIGFTPDDFVLTRMQDGFPDGVRPIFGYGDDPNAFSKKCPYGQVGDRIWVRETWAVDEDELDPTERRIIWRADRAASWIEGEKQIEKVFYLASDYAPDKWRPSLFMPRWASRILLEITEVRVERLNDISEEDAKAEGVDSWLEDMEVGYLRYYKDYLDPKSGWEKAKLSFETLWASINGPESLALNPWCWCVSFRVVPN